MADFVEGASHPEIERFAELERRFDRGDFDLVAVGRALLSDPQWLQKIIGGNYADLKPYSLATKEELY
jgi:2,4-dienoyl-CoA reductase-like NADH-dependent reductase (Old Yellow Enzyme family)